jgi:hypothetical protein
MNDGYLPDPAVEPLKSVLGYLTEMVRLDDRAIERVADYPSVDDQHLILCERDLEHLPGITFGGADDDGAIWLRVKRQRPEEAPAVDVDLGPWIEVPADPDQRPRVRDSIELDVEVGQKDRLIAAKEARPENCAPTVNKDASTDTWHVRLVLDDHPDLAKRLWGYIDGPWASWAGVEVPRRKATAVYERLLEIAARDRSGSRDQPLELVWGIGVSRWKRGGHDIDLPVIERLAELEVIEKPEAEVRIRPRGVGAIVNLKPFEPLAAGSMRLALDSARRVLEAIENEGEISPFVRDSFEPVLNVVRSQLDPQGFYWADQDPAQSSFPDAGENLVVSDRWVIFARPRSDSFILRDIDRLKDAIDLAGKSEDALVGAARALVLVPDEDARGRGRQALVSAIGRPIEITPPANEKSEDHGDLFFPLPFDNDQIEIVRRLEKADGLVLQCAAESERTSIANVICHYLALGLRVLVVSNKPATLAALRDTLPPAIRELTLGLTSTDKEGLGQIETVVRRLQSIVEALKPREQVTLINKLELDVIATRRRIAEIDDEIADLARRDLQLFRERAELPFDLSEALAAIENAHSWFEDRPSKFLAETDLSTEMIDAVRDARIRVGDDLRYIDDRLPALSELPEPSALGRLHNDLREASWLSSDETNETRFACRAVMELGLEGAGRLAADLEALAAGYQAVAGEKWLTSLFPIGKRGRRDEAAMIALVDFAREASSHLGRRAGFLARPVGTAAEAIVNKELLEVVERLSEGKRAFTAFAFRDKRLKSDIDSITVAGFAPTTAEEWGHVRDYLAWRRDIRALVERWRSLALELLAPAIDEEYPRAIHGLEWIVRLIDVGISATANAKRNIAAVAESKLAMSRGELETMFADPRQFQQLGAAVRVAVTKLEVLRGELDRLQGLLTGVKILSASVRQDFWSKIGSDQITAEEVEAQWTKLRERIQGRHERHADLSIIAKVSKKVAEAGAPLLAQRLRTEPASPETGDPVLPANWVMAWNAAALILHLDHPHLRERLRNFAEQRQRCELRLRELFEALVVARAHLGLSQNLTVAVKQALTAFTIAMRNVQINGASPIGNRHRRVARAALEGCYDGIPCWLMPGWRVAEQLPAKLGGFDLAIIDGASQCDVRALTVVLRGRKILVIGEDKPTSALAISIASDKIDWLEHNCLRNVPKTIRPFLLPGCSLYDLTKVVFPDTFSMGATTKRALVGPAAVVREAPSRPAVDEGTRRFQPVLLGLRAEESFHPEVRSEVPALTRSREAIDLDAPVIPVEHGDRDEPAMPRLVQPLISIPSDFGPSEPLDRLPPLRPAEEAPFSSIASAAIVRNPPWHALAARRGLAVVAGFVIAFVFVGTVYLLLGLNRGFQGGSQASAALQSVAVQAATEPAPNPSEPKVADRIQQSASLANTQTDRLQQATTLASTQTDRIQQTTALASTQADRIQQTTPLTNTQPIPQGDQIDTATAATSGGVITQRAVLFEEDPADPKGGSRLSGSVNWHSESGASAPGGTGVLVKADVEIPDRRLSVTMSLRRNTDHAMPASHVVEFKFTMPADSPYGGVAKMVAIQMKQQLEQIRGGVLAGMVAKVTAGYFLVGLSATDFELRRNLSMLKERSWIEIPFVYGNGTRAILDMEKGTPGERALSEAFVAWGE